MYMYTIILSLIDYINVYLNIYVNTELFIVLYCKWISNIIIVCKYYAIGIIIYIPSKLTDGNNYLHY